MNVRLCSRRGSPWPCLASRWLQTFVVLNRMEKGLSRSDSPRAAAATPRAPAAAGGAGCAAARDLSLSLSLSFSLSLCLCLAVLLCRPLCLSVARCVWVG